MGDIKTRFTIEGEQQYRNAMTQAANAVKVLNSQEKLAKAQFEQTGNAEKYAAAQADILRQKITQQKTAVAAAEKALKQLSDNGVSKNSKQFQQWQTKLLTAQTALTKMETELGKVTTSMESTTDAAEKTGDAVGAIGKKVSFDGVIGGIGKITGAMQAAAGAAFDLGKQLGSMMLDAASWADELATDAVVYGMTPDQLQRMRAAAWKFDTTVEAIIKSQQKLENNMYNGSEYFEKLGVSIATVIDTGFGKTTGGFRDWYDVFWETGNALMHYGDAIERDNIAQALFGKSWRELLPLFTAGREEYESFMEGVDTNTDETVEKLLALDDSWNQLQDEWNVLKNTVFGELAPSFTKLSDAAGGLLKQFNEYLKTDEGKEKMEALGEAVTSLFEGITEADFGAAMDTAKGAIDSLTSGLKWIKQNWAIVSAGLRALGAAFATLKVAESVLTFMQLAASGKFLFGGGGNGGEGGTTVVAGGGKGLFSGLLSKVTDFLAGSGGVGAGGLVLPELLGGLWLEWKAAWKLLNDNMNDPLLNQVYGDEGGEGGIIDNLTEEQAKRMREYFRQYKDNYGSEDAKDARDALSKAFEEGGVEMTEQAVSLVEGIFDNYLKENPDDLVDKLLASHPEIFAGLADGTGVKFFDTKNTADVLTEKIGLVPLTVEPKPEENAAEKISQDVGVVTIKANIVPFIFAGGYGHLVGGGAPMGLGSLGGESMRPVIGNANGLPMVPWDGYPAILHKGERVLTAQQNRNYTANSNTYFEHVTVNNGMDADAMAARIAAAQQRAMSAFGS